MNEPETKSYEAPQVRTLGSLHEITQGGFPGLGHGGLFGGHGDPRGHHASV